MNLKYADWVQCSTESFYLWSLMAWAATFREVFFCSDKDSSPFYVDNSPPYLVKAQKIKIIEPRSIHQDNYGLSEVLGEPKVVHLGRTSMIIECDIFMTSKTLIERFSAGEKKSKPSNILIAKTRAVIIFAEEATPVSHPFGNVNKKLISLQDPDLKHAPEQTNLKKIFNLKTEGRPSDVDDLGHVHNANYIFMFNDALLKFLSSKFDLISTKLHQHINFMDFEIEYLLPLDCLQKAEINLFLSENDIKSLEKTEKPIKLDIKFDLVDEKQQTLTKARLRVLFSTSLSLLESNL